ncbi:hypothetical protein GCM10009530_07930 [Microbispora corallina]|uniref:Uncharacterized protein n=1 Tax=Microbispora corallina TaxID=83302 RepID=A0ABQ4FVA0_9ACTN|nr:hypothetical protein [Microbispora corallina]GIH38756.1 hypothetical protein Mco01_17560 [Microbispora corallina]
MCALLAAGLASLWQTPAHAAAAGNGDHGPIYLSTGNGSNNQNEPRVFSPTWNKGIQVVSVNGKNTATEASFCRRHPRLCKINQNIWFQGR